MHKLLFFIGLFLFGASPASKAAPTPLTGHMSHYQPHILTSPIGFTIHTQNTDWKLLKTQAHKVLAIYKNNRFEKALFTITHDVLKVKNFKSYLKQHIKNYKHFGLKVKKIKPIHSLTGFLISVNSEQDNSLRSYQALLRNKQDVIILSCSAQLNKSKTVTQECSQMFKNFSWKK